ncbi:MAG: LemA family protein [Prevotellaceae bacterium]|jgi:LemA protein|nr:LemA family protein [Prevotellaceae bacterium]
MRKLQVFMVVVVAALMSSCSLYNRPVELEEKVAEAWSQVENQYQRRSDLIPNLVETVKGYTKHEQETLTAVMDARAKATQVTIAAEHLDDASVKKFQQAQAQVTSALGRLMAVAENYPNLKANQNFLELQAQLEGTENRIAVARKNFNEAVREYNTFIRRFPNNIFAGMFGFQAKGYFEAEQGADKAPKVQF